MFVSEASGLPMTLPETPMKQTIPRQLPKGVSAEKAEAQAKSAKNSFTAILIIEVILSFFLKGIIDDLWGLFLILQVLAYMSIYDMLLPATVELYTDGFRDVVTFQMLKPDPILNLFKPGLTLDALMNAAKGANSNLPQTMESSGQSASLIVNMIMYVMALVAFLVFVGILYVLLKVKGLKSKIQRVIDGIKKKTFWNNTIRSVTISYLETAIQLRNKI